MLRYVTDGHVNGWNTSTDGTRQRMEHVNGRKFTEKKEKNKLEEIQLANLARASQATTYKSDLLYPGLPSFAELSIVSNERDAGRYLIVCSSEVE